MKRFATVLTGAVLVGMLSIGPAHAVPVKHKLEVAAGETKTWNGTAAVGANVNYNGLVDEATAGECSDDVDTKCEYALLTVSNPVPDSDADGKLKRNLTITLDSYSIPSPGSDFDFRVFTTDAEGTKKGDEVGFSANTDVVDPDEQSVVSIQTTKTTPTVYLLVEVAYFTSLNATYKATVKF